MKKKWWTPAELIRLRKAFPQYQEGTMSEEQLRSAFRNRSMIAIKHKVAKLAKFIRNGQAPVVVAPAALVVQREPRVMRVIDEHNTIVTYREVL